MDWNVYKMKVLNRIRPQIMDKNLTEKMEYWTGKMIEEIGELLSLLVKKKYHHTEYIYMDYLYEIGDIYFYMAFIELVISVNVKETVKRKNVGKIDKIQIIMDILKDVLYIGEKYISEKTKLIGNKTDINIIKRIRRIYEKLLFLYDDEDNVLELNDEKLMKRHGATYNPAYYTKIRMKRHGITYNPAYYTKISTNASLQPNEYHKAYELTIKHANVQDWYIGSIGERMVGIKSEDGINYIITKGKYKGLKIRGDHVDAKEI